MKLHQLPSGWTIETIVYAPLCLIALAVLAWLFFNLP